MGRALDRKCDRCADCSVTNCSPAISIDTIYSPTSNVIEDLVTMRFSRLSEPKLDERWRKGNAVTQAEASSEEGGWVHY